jgi:diadenosine tetraphosphate (Ap4A) HIT family hydrolase
MIVASGGWVGSRGMSESAQQMYERATAAATADGRLAMPAVAEWDTFPFEGDVRVRPLTPPAAEAPRQGEDPADCRTCAEPDEAYVWSDERWRLAALRQPSGLPVVVILYPRAHLDLGDLPDDLAADMGLLTVRVERAVRRVGGIGRVHVGRWGDGGAHLHVWFMARPEGLLQLRGSFAAIWDDILPPLPEEIWRANLATVAAAMAEGGGTAHAAAAHPVGSME